MDEVKFGEMEMQLIQATRLGMVNNILQLRVYTLKNELLIKKTFVASDFITLVREKADYFNDKEAGPYISRCTVRTLDTVKRDWTLLPTVMEVNKCAQVFDSDLMTAIEWKMELFSDEDEVMAEDVSEVPFAEEYIYSRMISSNARYATLCVHEAGAPEGRYRFYRIIINSNYNLFVVGPNGKPVEPYVAQKGEDLETLYAKAFERDMKESERILSQGKHKRNG